MAKQQKHVTPKGVAIFPHLNTPDTKFDRDGAYNVTLKLHEGDDGVQKLLDMIDEATDTAYQNALKDIKSAKTRREIEKQVPYDYEEDEDTGERTGYVLFKFRRKASGVDDNGKRWKATIPMFDAKKNPVTEQVGGGSVIRVSFHMAEYYVAGQKKAGVSMRIAGVQVLELKSFGVDADSLGFDEEDGFESSGEVDAGESGEQDEPEREREPGEDDEPEDENESPDF